MSTSEDPFADPVSELHTFLASQEAEEARLQAELNALQDRTRRARRAIEVLTDQRTSAARKSASSTAKSRWVPRQDKLDAALAALAAGAHTVQEVARHSGMAVETARRAIEHLRGEERVRVTGTTKSGHMTIQTYAPMPTAVNDAA